MRKILITLVAVLGVVFTSCNSTLEEPGKTIACYNSGSTTLAIVPLDKDGYEMTEEAVMLYRKRSVKMTFPAECEYTMIIVDPRVYKIETGMFVISGPRYYKTGICDGFCYNYSYSGQRVIEYRGRISEENMNELPEGTLVVDTYVDLGD